MTGINSEAHWQRMIETSPSAVVDVFRRKWKDNPRLRLQGNGQDHGSIEVGVYIVPPLGLQQHYP